MKSIDSQTEILLKNFDWQNPKSLENLGYIFFGPLIFNYFAWLKSEISECDKILFNSREGLLLQEIYELFKNKFNLPPSVYFKTSRRLSSVASFTTESNIYETFKLHRYKGSLHNLLKYRFGINVPTEANNLVDSSIAIPNLNLYVNDILKNSKQVRDEYSKYITHILDKSKNVAMIDSGYQGTTQSNIEKTFGVKFKGRYIIYKGNALLDDVKGFYDFKNNKLKDNIIFLESVFTDKVGTYVDIVNGKFINETSTQTQIYFDDKIKIVNGIKKFVTDMFEAEPNLSDPSNVLSDYIFDLMCTKDYIVDETLFRSFFHDNLYTRDVIKKINRK